MAAFLPEPVTASAKPFTAHLLSLPAKDKQWNADQELLISFELARFEGRSHRPFVAVCIEDEAGNSVRQVASWYNKPRWLHDLRDWYNLRVSPDTFIPPTSSLIDRRAHMSLPKPGRG